MIIILPYNYMLNYTEPKDLDNKTVCFCTYPHCDSKIDTLEGMEEGLYEVILSYDKDSK